MLLASKSLWHGVGQQVTRVHVKGHKSVGFRARIRAVMLGSRSKHALGNVDSVARVATARAVYAAHKLIAPPNLGGQVALARHEGVSHLRGALERHDDLCGHILRNSGTPLSRRALTEPEPPCAVRAVGMCSTGSLHSKYSVFQGLVPTLDPTLIEHSCHAPPGCRKCGRKAASARRWCARWSAAAAAAPQSCPGPTARSGTG